MRWHKQYNVSGVRSNVVVVPSDELRRVRAQHRPPHSRCLLLITGSLGKRQALTYKQTNKQTKKRCAIARVTQPTHTRFRLLQKIVARYPADIPSFPDDGLESLFMKHSLSNRFACGYCWCVFCRELNLGGNVKELPPSTSSLWKVRSHFNPCDSLTGFPRFPRLVPF